MSESPIELVFQDLALFVYGDAPRCVGCSRVEDATAAVMPADARELTFDIAVTFDGAVVVTDAFRDAAEAFAGVEFSPVESASGTWTMHVEPVVRLEPFDSHVNVGPECATCGRPRYVTRRGPLVLQPDELLPVGFSRSDVGFGDTADFGPDQPVYMRPSVFVDRATSRSLKSAGLLGVHVIAQP